MPARDGKCIKYPLDSPKQVLVGVLKAVTAVKTAAALGACGAVVSGGIASTNQAAEAVARSWHEGA